MQLEHLKTAMAGVWAIGLGALAFSVNVNSISGWTLLLALGLLPPLVLLRIWNHPAPTTSESIREVLR